MTITFSPLTSDPPISPASAGIVVGSFGCDYMSSPPPSMTSGYSPSTSSDEYGDKDEDEDEDEDEDNYRVAPHWPSYRDLFESHGYHLDTCKDVRQFYLRYWEARNIQHSIESCAGYQSACREGRDDDELCRDEGLPERLFRGKRLSDDRPIVIKAVHRRSRELKVICTLSAPPLNDDPMNHCIPILDIIHAPHDVSYPFPHAIHRDQLSFIVMEEWSSQFIPPEQPHTLKSYLNSIRHCIQHIVFMHTHCFAHLDIAPRNILTDYDGRYAYVDYEMSRRFCRPPVEVEEGEDPRSSVLVYQPRAAEVPPEVENGQSTSPYAMDVWALGMLISRTCASTGFSVPELRVVIEGMLDPQWERRPSAKGVLRRFEKVTSTISKERLNGIPHDSYSIPTVQINH